MQDKSQSLLKKKYMLIVRACLCRDLSAADLSVLVAILERFNVSAGAAWPSLTCLADDTGRARKTVQRSISRLERAGLVEVSVRGDSQASNRYRPLLERGVHMTLRRIRSDAGAMPLNVDDVPRGGDKDVPRGGDKDVPRGGDKDVPLTHSIETHSMKPEEYWLRMDGFQSTRTTRQMNGQSSEISERLSYAQESCHG